MGLDLRSSANPFPGQATGELTRFRQVIGVEPGPNMVAQAKSIKAQEDKKDEWRNVDFVNANAEELPMFEDGSVDLLISAQACHWFDWEKGWKEWARVLRQHGTLAFWVRAPLLCIAGYVLTC